jgi:hypothetical protein
MAKDRFRDSFSARTPRATPMLKHAALSGNGIEGPIPYRISTLSNAKPVPDSADFVTVRQSVLAFGGGT